MASLRHLRFLLPAVLLPGALSAQVFTSHSHLAAPPSHVEVSLSYGSGAAVEKVAPGKIDAGDWEITVGFDAAACEVYCSYRRKSARPLTAVTLPPPLAEIRVFMDSGAVPLVFTFNPAGVGMPVLRPAEFSRQQEIEQRPGNATHSTEQRRECLPPSVPVIQPVAGSRNLVPAKYSLRI